MKKLLAVLALLLLASPVSAQGRFFQIYRDAINDTVTAAVGVNAVQNPGGYLFQAESTIVIPTWRFPRLAIAVRVIPGAGDTSTAIRLAIQVRAHLSDSTLAGSYADTAATFAWGNIAVVATNAVPDSVLNAYSTSGLPNGAGAGILAPSEFVVNFVDVARGRGTMKSNEFFGSPAGIYLPLTNSRGINFWAPYTSIRVRCISGASNPRIILHVVALE